MLFFNTIFFKRTIFSNTSIKLEDLHSSSVAISNNFNGAFKLILKEFVEKHIFQTLFADMASLVNDFSIGLKSSFNFEATSSEHLLLVDLIKAKPIEWMRCAITAQDFSFYHFEDEGELRQCLVDFFEALSVFTGIYNFGSTKIYF